MNFTVFVQNRTMISPISEKTPYEGIFGIPPDVSKIRPFGCKCWMLIEHADQKFAKKSKECLFLGFEEGKDGYLIFDIQENCVKRSRNVIFDNPTESVVMRKSPRLAEQNNLAMLTQICKMDTPYVKQALEGHRKDDWMKAIKQEYTNLVEHGAWEPVDASQVDRYISSMLILKVKRDAIGAEARLKARLVALGNHQIPDVDFGETYAPTLKEKTLMIMLALCNSINYEIDHVDVDGAYLNANLNENIIMKIPQPLNNGPEVNL